VCTVGLYALCTRYPLCIAFAVLTRVAFSSNDTKSQPTVPPPGRPRGRSTGVKCTYECSTVGTVSLSRNDVIGV
jgi:hypothetical protein